jgi:RimJ/RimL family protein N-acetyltransferase
MEIRTLTKEDAGAFQALRLIALRECPPAFASSYGEECEIPIAVVAERIAPSSDRCLFGAFNQSALIGCIGLQRETKLKLAHKALIWGMYVAASHRNKGIGRELVTQALEFAASMPGLHNVTLSVSKGNSAALMLYERMEFKVFGVEPGAMLIDNELHDEIHMVRSVRSET